MKISELRPNTLYWSRFTDCMVKTIKHPFMDEMAYEYHDKQTGIVRRVINIVDGELQELLIEKGSNLGKVLLDN